MGRYDDILRSSGLDASSDPLGAENRPTRRRSPRYSGILSKYGVSVVDDADSGAGSYYDDLEATTQAAERSEPEPLAWRSNLTPLEAVGGAAGVAQRQAQTFPAAETALERLHAENEQDRGLLERLAIQPIKEWVPAMGRAAERVSRGIEGSLDPTKEPDYLGAAMYGAAVNPVTAPLLAGINAVMPGEAVDLFPAEPEKRAALGRGAVAGAVT